MRGLSFDFDGVKTITDSNGKIYTSKQDARSTIKRLKNSGYRAEASELQNALDNWHNSQLEDTMIDLGLTRSMDDEETAPWSISDLRAGSSNECNARVQALKNAMGERAKLQKDLAVMSGVELLDSTAMVADFNENNGRYRGGTAYARMNKWRNNDVCDLDNDTLKVQLRKLCYKLNGEEIGLQIDNGLPANSRYSTELSLRDAKKRCHTMRNDEQQLKQWIEEYYSQIQDDIERLKIPLPEEAVDKASSIGAVFYLAKNNEVLRGNYFGYNPEQIYIARQAADAAAAANTAELKLAKADEATEAAEKAVEEMGVGSKAVKTKFSNYVKNLTISDNQTMGECHNSVNRLINRRNKKAQLRKELVGLLPVETQEDYVYSKGGRNDLSVAEMANISDNDICLYDSLENDALLKLCQKMYADEINGLYGRTQPDEHSHSKLTCEDFNDGTDSVENLSEWYRLYFHDLENDIAKLQYFKRELDERTASVVLNNDIEEVIDETQDLFEVMSKDGSCGFADSIKELFGEGRLAEDCVFV